MGEWRNFVITILTLLLTGGGAKVWLDAWRQKRQDDSAAPATAVETANRVLVVSRETIERLDRRIQCMEVESEEMRKKSLEQDRRLGELETRLARWVSFGQDLVARWEYHRGQEHPPAVPEN